MIATTTGQVGGDGHGRRLRVAGPRIWEQTSAVPQVARRSVREVTGGLSLSPSSGEWTRRAIDRMNTDPESWEMWTGLIKNGAVGVYTSDGNPKTVTIPEDLIALRDPEWGSSYGMRVIRYAAPG